MHDGADADGEDGLVGGEGDVRHAAHGGAAEGVGGNDLLVRELLLEGLRHLGEVRGGDGAQTGVVGEACQTV